MPDNDPQVSDHQGYYYVSAIRRRRRRLVTPKISGPGDLASLLAPLFDDADREHFYVVLLSTKNHVLAVELVSVGSLSASIVHPREVFKPAIKQSAAAIVVVHNHPSGDPTPSSEDIEFSKRLRQAGELLGICVLDHVIFGVDSFLSLQEAGHLGG